jgi:cardiolipin synthase A/B
MSRIPVPAVTAAVARFERELADQFFSRASGAQLVQGNGVRLLRDAAENYPEWLGAIAAAEKYIHFETYIFHDDPVGRQFADALMAKARSGVRVRLLYDWLGSFGTPRRFWRELRAAGIEVRPFNPPRFDSPFAWFSRDHRKTITIDGKIGFVTGLCVSREWVGDPDRRIEQWRDTGVEIRGPGVSDLHHAFARAWSNAGGESLGREELPSRESIRDVGDIGIRVIDETPGVLATYRLDQLIAAGARERLWLTDAYFVGTTSYIRSLISAAKDGIDVRLLVPGASDIPVVKWLSRAAYRPLLEAGIRVFEWNGSMLHAKTATADGRWARIGSTNLNLASWVGNWELNVAVEDDRFAAKVEGQYLQDLARSTEIVLDARRRIRPTHKERRARGRRHASRNRAASGLISFGSTIGAAITSRRVLGPAESKVMTAAGLLLLVLAPLLIFFPWILGIPVALFSAWIGVTLLLRAWRLHRTAPRTERR